MSDDGSWPRVVMVEKMKSELLRDIIEVNTLLLIC